MGTLKMKTECGHGGKLGHRNMAHFIYNDETKWFARRRRRLDDKAVLRAGAEALSAKGRGSAR